MRGIDIFETISYYVAMSKFGDPVSIFSIENHAYSSVNWFLSLLFFGKDQYWNSVWYLDEICDLLCFLQKYVPEKITSGVKQGFCSPDKSWFKGDSIQYVEERLLKDARLYDYLDKTSVHALVYEHLNGKKNRRLLIWSLLNVEQWIEAYIK